MGIMFTTLLLTTGFLAFSIFNVLLSIIKRKPNIKSAAILLVIALIVELIFVHLLHRMIYMG